MIIVVTETTRATYELTKYDVTKSVPAPTDRISSFDFVSLLPTLLFHTVREASRVRVRIVIFHTSGGGGGGGLATRRRRRRRPASAVGRRRGMSSHWIRLCLLGLTLE